MILRPIEFIVNDKENFAYNQNSIELLDQVEADIFISIRLTIKDNMPLITIY